MNMSIDIAAFIAGFRDWIGMNLTVIVVAALISGFFLGYLVRSIISRRRRTRVRQLDWASTWEWAEPIALTPHKANGLTALAPTLTQTRSLRTYRDAPPMNGHTPPSEP
jgi:hypothetical protein